jgi:outer membrane protein
MKKIAAVCSLLLLGMSASAAMAEQSPWQLRVRAAHIETANDSSPVGGSGASDRIHVSDKTILDLNLSYFFTPNIAAELVVTTPQKHRVYLDGASIGTFKHLPPTLTLQYHFTPASMFSPYVGAGINYTIISDEKLLGGQARLESDSVGLALQAGLDFKLDKNWSINFDVKKIQIRSDVYVGDTKISKVKIDPYLIGVGVGYRF